MLHILENFNIYKRITSLQLLLEAHTLCSLNRLTFSMVRALVIHQHVKHMPKIQCLGVLLCFQVHVHSLALSQLCSRTHLMDTASISLPLMGRSLAAEAGRALQCVPAML